MAKYYDFDSDYLIEKEPGVHHYGLNSQTSPSPLRTESCDGLSNLDVAQATLLQNNS